LQVTIRPRQFEGEGLQVLRRRRPRCHCDHQGWRVNLIIEGLASTPQDQWEGRSNRPSFFYRMLEVNLGQMKEHAGSPTFDESPPSGTSTTSKEKKQLNPKIGWLLQSQGVLLVRDMPYGTQHQAPMRWPQGCVAERHSIGRRTTSTPTGTIYYRDRTICIRYRIHRPSLLASLVAWTP